MERKDGELEKRFEDIRAIRKLLAEGTEFPLIHPWAFFTWAVLVIAGTLVHYKLFRNASVDVRTALVWVWLPVLILGTIAESVSFAVRVSKQALPLFNRRLGGAILSCIASMVVLTVVVIRLALVALTPGIVILLCTLPIVFYAQMSYASLFIETFAGLAVGLLFEFAGAQGPELFMAAGFFAAALYAITGIHVMVLERRPRG